MTLAIKTLNFRQFMQLGTLWALLSASPWAKTAVAASDTLVA